MKYHRNTVILQIQECNEKIFPNMFFLNYGIKTPNYYKSRPFIKVLGYISYEIFFENIIF